MDLDFEPIFSYQFRVVLIGDSSVGKSSLLTFFTQNLPASEKEREPTVGVDFFTRVIEVDHARKIKVKLHIWDTAGQERFRAICRSYYQKSAAAIIVFDITQFTTFEHIPEWVDEAAKNVRSHCKQALFVLVGNKSDREDERVVPVTRAKRLASSNGMDYLETSAITGQNIDTLFEHVAVELYRRVSDGRIPVADETSTNGGQAWDGVKVGRQAPRHRFSLEEHHASDSLDLKTRCCPS